MDTTSTPPLQDWKIVGFEERWYVTADVKVPGGSCWHCDTAIAYCVIIENKHDRTRHEIIGSQCAERVGMDMEQLARYRAQFNQDRADRQYAADEAALAARFGEHGTRARFESGCPCDRCEAAAPHGTWTQWRNGCRCIDCVEGRIADNPDDYWIDEKYPVIVELATGRIVRAEVVDSKFGRQWRVRATTGDTVYLARFPKRRTTHSKKGFTEAVTVALVTGGRDGHRLELPLAEPLIDNWGEPIPHPAP